MDRARHHLPARAVKPPKPEWKLPTVAECETLGALAFQCGDAGPSETIVGDERLVAWRKGWEAQAYTVRNR